MSFPDYPEVEKWTKHTWLNHPEEGRNKKRLQCCLDSRGHTLCMRAIQGHSGETESICRCRTMWKSRTLGLNTLITLDLRITAILLFDHDRFKKKGRQTIFFTAVDPMNEPQEDEPCDVTEPREVPQRTKWKMYHAVHWINLKSAQDRGVACWQTHSNVTVLDNSVPADCLEKVVHSNTEEIRCQKILFSLPRPRTTYPQERLALRRPSSTRGQFRVNPSQTR